MLDIATFVTYDKAMLIAPAGYGKTHSIAAAMNRLQGDGKHLILTHTHAGIASIKEKLSKEHVPAKSFHIETISGFAQRYVLSFYRGVDIPQPADKNYFGFILKQADRIFALGPIKRILTRSYKSLFVDEFQDCTQKQYALIQTISKLFPTRFLGDPLQGIFQFNALDPLVDMDNNDQMKGFAQNQFHLTQPQRWLHGNNENLGKALGSIRQDLLKGNPIDISSYGAIEHHCLNEQDINDPKSKYYKIVSSSLSSESLLIIHPTSTSIQPRLNLVKKFNNRFVLLEAIDEKDFYNLAGKLDHIVSGQAALKIKEICSEIFNKTELGNWFNEKGLKSKSTQLDKELAKPLKNSIDEVEANFSFLALKKCLLAISRLPLVKCYRKELFNCLCKALQHSHEQNMTVLESMVEVRNLVRRFGKKTKGKCIGTTLLTKGLEFETVIVLDAHKFECRKHLYVALTRASKRLIVISKTAMLTAKSSSM